MALKAFSVFNGAGPTSWSLVSLLARSIAENEEITGDYLLASSNPRHATRPLKEKESLTLEPTHMHANKMILAYGDPRK